MTLTEIKKKELVINKSWKYLGRTLRHYGHDFVSILRANHCIATAIGDKKLSAITGKQYNNHLFLLFDKGVRSDEMWERAIKFFRSHKSYEIDYPYEHDNFDLHVVVINIPKRFKDAIKYFKKSKYSEMYTKDQLNDIFNESEKKYDTYMVLNKSKDYIPIFENIINDLAKDQHERTRIKLPPDAELDFKFKEKEEIFNYNYEPLSHLA